MGRLGQPWLGLGQSRLGLGFDGAGDTPIMPMIPIMGMRMALRLSLLRWAMVVAISTCGTRGLLCRAGVWR